MGQRRMNGFFYDYSGSSRKGFLPATGLCQLTCRRLEFALRRLLPLLFVGGK